MQQNKAIALLTLALAISMSPSPADAELRSTLQNAVGACNGALPGYEGALRKRPLAIANEGISPAIVSCSLPAEQVSNAGNTDVLVGLINRSTSLVAVSCTLVGGIAPELSAGQPNYYVKNVAIPAGEGANLVWEAGDYGLLTFSAIASVSCGLAPKVEIALVANFRDD